MIKEMFTLETQSKGIWDVFLLHLHLFYKTNYFITKKQSKLNFSVSECIYFGVANKNMKT